MISSALIPVLVFTSVVSLQIIEAATISKDKGVLDATDIFVPSVNNAQWHEAKKDCENEGYTLAELTEADLPLLDDIQDQFDMGKAFYVNAAYDKKEDKFVWQSKSGASTKWINKYWKDGQKPPNMDGNSALQITKTINGVRFTTINRNYNQRFLCRKQV